jgi:hypothetical protein
MIILSAISLFFLIVASCKPPNAVELQEIAHRDTSGWAHDIALDGNDVYVADRQGGFLIFNRANNFALIKRANPVKDVISLTPNSGMPILASRFEGVTWRGYCWPIFEWRYSKCCGNQRWSDLCSVWIAWIDSDAV